MLCSQHVLANLTSMTEQKFSLGLKMIWPRDNKDSRPITFGLSFRSSGFGNLQGKAGLDNPRVCRVLSVNGIRNCFNDKSIDWFLKQSLSGKLNLSTCLTSLVTSLAHANHATISKLDLVFNIGMWTGTVMREVDASQSAGAEEICAVCYRDDISLSCFGLS